MRALVLLISICVTACVIKETPILKLFQSERGGTTIYQLSEDEKMIF